MSELHVYLFGSFRARCDGRDIAGLESRKTQEMLGYLLQGCYQDWCLCERERLQQLYLGALDRLMEYSEIHGEYAAGLTYGGRILRLDCARERTHRGMMRLYHLNGDRTAALRQYERCAATLKKELGVLPA